MKVPDREIARELRRLWMTIGHLSNRRTRPSCLEIANTIGIFLVVATTVATVVSAFMAEQQRSVMANQLAEARAEQRAWLSLKITFDKRRPRLRMSQDGASAWIQMTATNVGKLPAVGVQFYPVLWTGSEGERSGPKQNWCRPQKDWSEGTAVFPGEPRDSFKVAAGASSPLKPRAVNIAACVAYRSGSDPTYHYTSVGLRLYYVGPPENIFFPSGVRDYPLAKISAADDEAAHFAD